MSHYDSSRDGYCHGCKQVNNCTCDKQKYEIGECIHGISRAGFCEKCTSAAFASIRELGDFQYEKTKFGWRCSIGDHWAVGPSKEAAKQFVLNNIANATKDEVPDNVVPMRCITKLDVDPEQVIRGAKEANLTEVVVVGTDADGKFYFAGSHASGPETLWMLEEAKQRLLKMVIGDN